MYISVSTSQYHLACVWATIGRVHTGTHWMKSTECINPSNVYVCVFDYSTRIKAILRRFFLSSCKAFSNAFKINCYQTKIFLVFLFLSRFVAAYVHTGNKYTYTDLSLTKEPGVTEEQKWKRSKLIKTTHHKMCYKTQHTLAAFPIFMRYQTLFGRVYVFMPLFTYTLWWAPASQPAT